MFPDVLIDAAKNGDMVLFVGAGLSTGAGLPGWATLFRPLADRIGLNWPCDNNDVTVDLLLRTAQYYDEQQGRNALVSYLQNKLDSGQLKASINHSLLASLPANIWFTTNYDNFLERSFLDIGKTYNLIVDEAEITFWKQKQTQLIKLCGDLARPNSIVVTQRDFNNYPETHSRIVARLRSVLETSSVLFLGYSLRAHLKIKKREQDA